jgi:protein SCO1/2
MRSLKSKLFILAAVVFWSACGPEMEQPLPIIGNKHVENGDTVYHEVPDFKFINQDSQWVTPATFDDKIYVTDFFFTSCPTICPIVKKQMLRIYDRFEGEDRLLFLSHSVDGRRDSVPRLKVYSENIGIKSDRWHLVTGDIVEIYEIADDYFSVAKEDPEAPGGYDHSGRLILVDEEKHVRSFCDGTIEAEVNRFMEDIERLLDEVDNSK